MYCINAVCADEPEVDPGKYGGAPYVKCDCWQQGEGGVTESLVPAGNAGGNIVLGGEDSFVGGAGGEGMCDAIKAGALISTFGPSGELYGGISANSTSAYGMSTILCLPFTPFAYWYEDLHTHYICTCLSYIDRRNSTNERL